MPFDFIEDEAEEQPTPEPRMRQMRRTILDEIDVEGATDGTGTVTGGEGGRVELGAEVDADATIERAPKGPAWEPTDEERAELADVERRRGLASEMQGTTAIGDALRGANPLSSDGTRSAERSRERLRNLWDQITSGDAGLGGRNSLEAVVGEDRRGEAPTVGFLDTATLGFADEAAGAASGLTGGDYRETRDRLRERAADVRAQAPEATGLGQALGTLPWMALPGASQASAGIGAGARLALATGQGAQLGAMGAFGASESDLLEDPEAALADTVEGAALGGLAGFAGQAAGDALGAVARGPSTAPRDVAARRAAADDALLAATGAGSGDSASVRAFDFGDTHDQIMASRGRAAQVLRDTQAVPAAGGMRATRQAIEQARGGATGVMDDVRTAMGTRGPTGSEIAERLRARAGGMTSPTGRETRGVLEDFAERYGGQLDEATGARTALEGMRSPDAPVDFEALMQDIANLRDRGAWRTRAGGDVSLGQQGQRLVDRELRGAYDDAIEAQLAGRAGTGGFRGDALGPDQIAAAERLGPDPVGRYRQARQQYAVLDTALENARRGEERLAGNRLLGFSEQVGGLGFGGTGGAAIGAALGGPVGAGAGAVIGGVGGAAVQRFIRGVEPRLRASAMATLTSLAEQYPRELAARLGPPAVRWLLERGGRAAAPAIAAEEAPAERPRAPEESAPSFDFEPDEEEMPQ
jgi:hypothetical protein